ncbi:uncharacterized protein SAPINGB_P004958 [Magnusiomyces paraingens]|uniref:Putative 5'-nucleotidase C-terminal domain-containing protein n=1 Tax=Magnusiomyces paraingens TaxID=2606893 RepID=A0A5E8BXW7_9ASCO|nr:uncharacterized protein SAPINGB_P004958 [Saprochaete ingens]VVT56314.1 unnamed protein product [Saprochaete ingens]
MKLTQALLVLLLPGTALASVADIAQQPSAEPPNFSAEIRPLTWGQLNIIHTTDTHSWQPGHLLEPGFSADWGDIYSFVSHLKKIGKDKGSDVLFVDSGDRHDGNGFGDATSPGGILVENLFLYQNYDILTVGNHELYKYETGVSDFLTIGKYFGEKYVVSNVDIIFNNSWVPMGNRYRRFTTDVQKLNVVAFGFLFNFRGNNPLTRVTFVEDAVKQDWFREALSFDDTDVFIVAAHIPVRFFPEMRTIVNAIRKVHPHAIIQFLGGHSHIRDFVVLDKQATALESGRFLETIGWSSVNGIDKTSDNDNVTFSRTYIDTNLHSFTSHTNTTLNEKETSGKDFFHKKEGVSISEKITKYRKDLKLDEDFGCIPRDLFLNRAPYPGHNSLYSTLEEVVLPRLLGTEVSKSRSLVHPRYIIINTGSIRFDLFKGPYTRDSGYIVSPFKNNWLYIPDVPLKYAKKILPELNKVPYILSADDVENDRVNSNSAMDSQGRITTEGLPQLNYLDMNIPQSRHMYYRSHQKPQQHSQQNSGNQVVFDTNEKYEAGQSNFQLTPGYVTYDDFGNDGDDTYHSGWRFHQIPNAIQASQNIPSEDDENLIDVVFYDFIKPFLIDALEKIGYSNYTFSYYGGASTVELLTDHVTEFWSANC